MRFASVFLVGTLLCFSFKTGATVLSGYGIDGDRNLWGIDLGTGDTTLVGALGLGFLGLAADAAGNLYGANGVSIYAIDKNDASSGYLGSFLQQGSGFSYDGGSGLDFIGTELAAVSKGQGAAAGPAPFKAFTIDLTPGYPLSTTDLVISNSLIGRIRASANFAPGTMILTSDRSSSGCSGFANCLHTLDLASGATAFIGDLKNGITGLDVASDGTLYGLSNNGEILQIDTQTAERTVIKKVPHLWLGFTLVEPATVPAPTTTALLALGLLGAAFSRRKAH